jgi:hypothetical protein
VTPICSLVLIAESCGWAEREVSALRGENAMLKKTGAEEGKRRLDLEREVRKRDELDIYKQVGFPAQGL